MAIVTYEASDGYVSAPMVGALEGAWSAIRDRHQELPAVVVVLAAGSIGTPAGTLKLGHFAATRWSTPGAEALAEVFVGGEGLGRDPVAVLGTLLHEAAHALAHVREVQDTSRQGRYHNRRYAALARELGLSVAEIGTIGWSDTTVTDATREVYAAVVEQLRAALTLTRRAEGGRSRPTSNNPRACVCGCGRKIRAAAATLEAGPIICGLCGSPFEPQTPADDTGNDADGGDNEDGGEGE